MAGQSHLIASGRFREGEAPAEPRFLQKPRLGRSLALAFAVRCDCPAEDRPRGRSSVARALVRGYPSEFAGESPMPPATAVPAVADSSDIKR